MSVLLFFGVITSCWASPIPSVLPSPYQDWWEDAIELEAEGAPSEALSRVLGIRRGQPDFLPALLAQGRLLDVLGRPEEALVVFDTDRYDPNILEGRVRVLMHMGRWEESLLLLDKLQSLGWTSAWFLKAQAMAPLDAFKAGEMLEEALHSVAGEIDDEELTACVLWVADALLQQGQPQKAQSVLGLAMLRFETAPESLVTLEDRVFIEVQAKWLRIRPNKDLSADALLALETAQKDFDLGHLDASLALLDAYWGTREPHEDVCWLRVRVLLELKRYEEAEQMLRLLEVVSPLDATPSIRLAELLRQKFPSEVQEAWSAYHRASKKEPTRLEIWLQKGILEARLGKLEAAENSLRRVQDLKASQEQSAQLQTAIDNQRRERLMPIQLAEVDGCDGIPTVEACSKYYRSMAYFYRAEDGLEFGESSDWEKSLRHLDEAQTELIKFAPAWNLRGAIFLARGQGLDDATLLSHAAAAYQRSLDIDPAQPRVLTLMGVLADWRGNDEDAVHWWLRAVQLDRPGSRDANLYLAEHASAQWQWWTAKQYLDTAFSQSGTLEEHSKSLLLRDRVTRNIRIIYGLSFGVLAIFLFGVYFWVRRTRSGYSLEGFLERCPDAHGSVSQVCASIRHEVVKHNTPLLTHLGDSTEEQRAVITRKLFGDRGAIVRFFEYVRSLENLALKHGFTLNLRRRDPVFRDLIRAMDELKKMGSEQIFEGRFQPRIRDISVRINTLGFEDLGGLIDKVSTTILSEVSVREIWQSVLGESSFRETASELSLSVAHDVPNVRIKATRSQFEDILSNLFRNAAMLGSETGHTEFQVSWYIEDDPITMHREVAIRVADSIPIKVDTEMIRSRYVARGLGIVNNMSEQLGGSVRVEAEAHFEKAIVVRLPVVESS